MSVWSTGEREGGGERWSTGEREGGGERWSTGEEYIVESSTASESFRCCDDVYLPHKTMPSDLTLAALEPHDCGDWGRPFGC